MSKSTQTQELPITFRSEKPFQAEHSYSRAKTKANWYVHTIQAIAKRPETFMTLQADLTAWHDSHDQSGPDSKLIDACQSGAMDSLSLLGKLQAKNQLKQYLRKTITYLFVRDLGLEPSDPQTAKVIDDAIKSIVNYVEKHQQSEQPHRIDDWLKSMLSKYDLTSTYRWLRLRLATVNQCFTDEQSRIEGMRKLVKVIAGIVMHQVISAKQELQPKALSDAIQLGYAYGLTYPFVDDLLDSNDYLSEADKGLFNALLRETLISGVVPEYPDFESTEPKLQLIYQELKWAFEYIHTQLEPTQREQFLEQAYIFFEAQTEDRERRLSNTENITIEALFEPVILKSAGCRIISRDLVSCDTDSHFDYRMFCFGIYNQFNDDIKDIFEDIREDNVTPYSYFLTNSAQQQLAENPYHYYWAVVYYLIYEVYANDAYVKQLLLERSVNAHRSLLSQVGQQTYNMLRTDLLNTPVNEFNAALQSAITGQAQVAWFDKLVSQEVAQYFKNEQQKTQLFKETYQRYLDEINQELKIPVPQRQVDNRILEVANYALMAGGKRIRPVIAQCIGRELYGFTTSQAKQVGSILEYMHTASLVMDDLPAQDNANTRRGMQTAHNRFSSVAAAELSVVYLMMHAVEAQTKLEDFPPRAVLASLRYAAATTKLICEGQFMDLDTTSRQVSIHMLERICHGKTGLALEASLVIPAILAEADELHISRLKALARHMGLVFQIRDDLLDATVNSQLLGKDSGADIHNQRVNFVTLYGETEAQDIMFEHHEAGQEIIKKMPAIQPFFSALLDLMIYRLH